MSYLKENNWGYVLLFSLLVVCTGWIIHQYSLFDGPELKADPKKDSTRSVSIKPDEAKKERAEYFFKLLRNPKTNRIPSNVRSRELQHARTMPVQFYSSKKSVFGKQSIENVDWQEVGPSNVGGRTRALGVDVDNSNTIIAGGVSGGIWKSTNGGASWDFKNSTSDRLSVTWLIQDTTSTNNDTWYYGTGEFSGNSASAQGAPFRGYGIFKSTDNGETWNRLAGTASGENTKFDSKFDFVSKLIINPATSSLFMTSNVGGIYKLNSSTGNSNLSLGGSSDHRYVDIAANAAGELIAVLSENRYSGTSTDSPGVYRSSDDGSTWSDITPGTFPTQHDRSFAAFAPSAPDTAYVITYVGVKATTSPNDSVAFHMIDLNSGGSTQVEDRSANMPDFGEPVGEIAQSNYNMILTVKPDNPDFVLLGFTNIYRSRDGFKTPATDKNDIWIGGFATANNVTQYVNHHPDQHALAFDPNDATKLWSGHDGGLSYTSDITVSGAVNWQDKNNGYNVTQYYDVSIADESGDQRVMGGTQDNGTPIFFTNVDRLSQADASTGDGGFSYFADNFLYASSQQGNTRRYPYNDNGLGGFGTGNFTNFAEISPPGASGQLFINPFAIDPNDETVIFYPAGTDLWRNTDIEDTNTDANSNIDGWEDLTDLSPAGGIITALEVSQSAPRHRLYYASFRSSATPLIYRIDNAHTASNSASNLVDISIPGAPSGAYVVNLEVNANDANELIAVMSNYEITGLYHSTNGGSSWTAIEGNLEGGSGSDFGPSIRDVTIVPDGSETIYLLATSTGVYSTKTLTGSSTMWSQEGPNIIGNVVSTSLAHRSSDNTLIVGTHGRGLFGKIPKQQDIKGNAGWRMMSAPVENMPIDEITDDAPIQGFGDGFEKNFFTGYDGNSFTTPANLSGNLTSGKGFIIFLFDNSEAGSSPLPVPISADGSEPAGDVTVTLHTNGDLFNLVGNPYNAAIDFDKVTLNAVENKWWVYDDATAQYYTYNGSTGVSEPDNDGHIAPWQGFFVKTQSGASSPSIVFSQDDKAHYDAQFYKDESKPDVRTIRFEVTGEELIDDNTVAVFYKGGKEAYDAGDMQELGSLSTSFASLAFQGKNEKNEDVRLSNEARSWQIRNPQAFQLDFNATKAGSYEMSWDFNQFPDNWRATLYDRKTNQTVEMNATSRYDFEVNTPRKSNDGGKPKLRNNDADDARFELTVKSEEIEPPSGVPDTFSLSQNYPNPFNATTTIKYDIAATSNVKISIFNSIGQRVAVMVDTEMSPGFHDEVFDASGLASGIYYCRMRAGDFEKTVPMTHIK